jgi:sugar phosphate isomerase/epimerase
MEFDEGGRMPKTNGMPTRREWLKLTATGALAAALPDALAAGTAAVAPAPESTPNPAGRPLKISLNAYSFNRALTAPATGGPPEMSLFDVLDFCAEHGFDGIDPTGYFFPGYPKVPADSYLHDLKRRAFKLGLAITGTGVRNNFAQADPAKRAADVQLVKDWIEVAAKLGAPVIRVFAGVETPGHPRDEVAAWMASDLKQCTEHGQRHGVLVGMQNHGDFLKTAEQVLDMVRRVDSDWFGVIVDTGNFQAGDPYEEIARVVPHAVNFQIKERPFGPNSPVRTDLRKLVQVIRAGGYRGYLPIETLEAEGQPYDPRILVPRFLAELRQAIG